MKELAASWHLTSQAGYRGLKEIFVAPTDRTVRTFVGQQFTETGFTMDMKKLLTDASNRLEPEDRICVMSFDEAAIEPEFVYVKSRDMVDGYTDFGEIGRRSEEAVKVLVFAIRGIRKRYKQTTCCISYYLTPSSYTVEDLVTLVRRNLNGCKNLDSRL